MAKDLKQLTYKIHLQAPVLITSTVGDENIAMSEDYLSGSSLRGMFAGMFLKNETLEKEAHEDERFKSWFLSEKLCFLNAYPASYDSLRTLPVPKSIQISKNDTRKYPDIFEKLFEKEDDEEEEIQQYDDFINKKDTKHQEGFCILNSKPGYLQFEKINVKKQFNFHHKRTNQQLGHSQDSEIFNYECLLPGQTFVGLIIGEETTLQAFYKAVSTYPPKAFIGRSKNTQYGEVSLDFPKIETGEAENKAIVAVNEASLKPAHLNIENADLCFTLTFLSHVILVNKNGQAVVDSQLLIDYLKMKFSSKGIIFKEKVAEKEPPEIQILKSFIRRESIENYIAIWKARTPSVSAFQMGSCFVIQIKKDLSDSQIEQIKDALTEIETEGIGIRRNEGFGRVVVNWQKEEKIKNDTKVKADEYKDNLKTPALPIPKTARDILVNIYITHLEEKVRSHAVADLSAFRQHPPASQISRLHHFALKSEKISDFETKLKALKDTAQKKLEKCHDKKRTLLDFLQTFSMSTEFKNLCGKGDTSQEKTLCATIDFQLDESQKFKLYQLYLNTFFALMQKNAKKEGHYES
ncbi:hypothetical protein JW964_06255 [candidate division KSB1 bacterium]|nr:hypothetical protein [candidate division KSB1 bacterium]